MKSLNRNYSKENNIRKLTFGCLALLFLLLPSTAQSYIIDGLVDDWGIDLMSANDIGYLDTNLPSGGLDIDYITEDNADNSLGWQKVGPGYSYNGNGFDTEAIYFDNDENYAYIAIIQGLSIDGAYVPHNPWLMPGDIGIDTDNNLNTGDHGYELGLSITNAHLYSVCSWDDVIYPQYAASNPWKIGNGVDLGLVDFIYSGNQNQHYVLEAMISLDRLGLSYGDSLGIHWTQQCGNDPLNLKADVNTVVPEPSTLTLFFMGILGFFIQISRKKYRVIRKCFDIVFSSAVLVLSIPVVIILAILVKADSPGPVFYKQLRVGLNRRRRRRNMASRSDKRDADTLGRPFNIYKFRTMYIDAESRTGAVWAEEDDPRITKIGRFLRKSRFDELPQFLNVLKGEMSIIGPRPERPEFVRDLNKSICSYYRRYHVKPGITGLAQVRYRYASSIEDTKKKVKYDLLYLKRRCLIMDLRIIFHTVETVLFAKGSR